MSGVCIEILGTLERECFAQLSWFELHLHKAENSLTKEYRAGSRDAYQYMLDTIKSTRDEFGL